MSQKFLEDMRLSQEKLEMLSLRLTVLADAFARTGNETVAEELDEMSGELNMVNRAVSEAVSKKVDDDYRQAKESSENILKTALAVGQLERKRIEDGTRDSGPL